MTLVAKKWLLAALAFTAIQLPGASTQERQSRVERSFHAEEKLKWPVKVPRDVLTVLRKDERVQTCLGDGESPNQIPSSWFAGSRIHLNDDRLTDLVVVPVNPCLFGANIIPYWVFQGSKAGYELVLRVSALQLNLMESKTAGYRDIEARAVEQSRHSVGLTFKFDGKAYVQRTVHKILIP